MLLTYRQEAHVSAALRSLLAQDHDDLEILVRDDHSPDDTFGVVQHVLRGYHGPHRVRAERNERNLGPHQSAWRSLEEATGEFIVEAHGDDLSYPGRVRGVAALHARTGASLITHNAHVGAAPGPGNRVLVEDAETRELPGSELVGQAWSWAMLGASFAYEKRLWTTFGPFDMNHMSLAGDHVVPARAAMLGGCWFLAEPLMFWRFHDQQSTAVACGLRDADPDITAEAKGAHSLPAQLQLLRDLQTVDAAHGPSPVRAALRQDVLVRLMSLGGAWSRSRARLEGAGLSLQMPPGAP